MAIYHCSLSIVARSKGHSAVAAAAYRSRAKLHVERQGKTEDYSRVGDLQHAEILAPENAPDWVHNREMLWNRVEAAEKRRDAQLVREVRLALPKELGKEQQVALLRSYVRGQFVDRGMVADLALHDKGDGNPHAHVLLTMRTLTAEGFGGKVRRWNGQEFLGEVRSAWATEANEALERAGHEERIDHRTLKAQREEAMARADQAQVEALDREPQIHIGRRAAAMQRRGIEPESRRHRYRSPVGRRRWVDYRRFDVGSRIARCWDILKGNRKRASRRSEHVTVHHRRALYDRQEAQRQHSRADQGIRNLFANAFREPQKAMSRFSQAVDKHGLDAAMASLSARPGAFGKRQGRGWLFGLVKDAQRQRADQAPAMFRDLWIRFQHSSQRVGTLDTMLKDIQRELDRTAAQQARAAERQRKFEKRWVERQDGREHQRPSGRRRIW